MQKSDFWFDLPPRLVAQTPASPRDAARLLCLGRRTGFIEHTLFSALPGLLCKNDVLVVNDSKVLPARLIGAKPDTKGVVELLLLKEVSRDVWECLARPAKRLRTHSRIPFGDGSLEAEILEALPDGGKLVRFTYDTATLYEKLDAFGKMPLPPYIKSQLSHNSDYQTVYARHPGSAAAPTAGLHFTHGLLRKIEESGVAIARLTLHVGLGTFRPVKTEEIEDHEMHAEWYSISEEAAAAIAGARAGGGRVIAVGTTSCRTLEAVAGRYGGVRAASGSTDIFLRPGSAFQVVDGLITNFHLPESTLIMLVAAFCGLENTLNAYREAIREEYRFFSFGDAMFIV